MVRWRTCMTKVSADVAPCQPEGAVSPNRLWPQLVVLHGEANPDDMLVGAHFGEGLAGVVNPDAEQLKDLATEHFLILPLAGNALVDIAGIAKRPQDQRQPAIQGHESLHPVLQIMGADIGGLELPRKIGGHVDLAGAARDAESAAQAGQPLVVTQPLSNATHAAKFGGGIVNLGQHGIQRLLVDTRMTRQVAQHTAMPFKVLQYRTTQVTAVADIEQIKKRGDRDLVMVGVGPLGKKEQAVEQVLDA